jgi:hypothetical protein
MAYQIMFYGGMAGTLISLGVAVMVFTKMDIFLVIEDLTGFRLRKNKDKPKGANFSFTEQSPKAKTFTNRLFKAKREQAGAISAKEVAAAEVLVDGGSNLGATTILSSYEDQTTLLSSHEDETTLLASDGDETTLLAPDEDATTLLAEDEGAFKIQLNVMVVHSETII